MTGSPDIIGRISAPTTYHIHCVLYCLSPYCKRVEQAYYFLIYEANRITMYIKDITFCCMLLRFYFICIMITVVVWTTCTLSICVLNFRNKAF